MQKIIFALLLSVFMLLGACNSSETSTKTQKLVIFHAGSLSVPFKQIAEAFEKENPGVEILAEPAGSRACARKISDLGRECDIMASADYTVIDKLLIPEHATWNIKFASNEMVIVFHETSEYANEINAQNWHEILLRNNVAYGRSDPNADPCGYRAVLTTKLAGIQLGKPNFANKLLAKNNEYIRPKETDLLALLETNTIDYIFLYRSVAQQHGLKYVQLPYQINLKSTEYAELYKQVSVEISGKKPGETITKFGEPMIYGITIPKNAANPKLALKFATFLLSGSKGMSIMEKNGQPSVVPSKTDSYNAMPEQLKQFAINGL